MQEQTVSWARSALTVFPTGGVYSHSTLMFAWANVRQ
jgi:hypothetical protein